MNIGERFFCSRCLKELDDEQVCPFCGYNPSGNEDSTSLQEGTLLDKMRYQLGTVIGRGGFGTVYAAWDLTLDMPVAIKEYFPKEICDRNTDETDEVRVREEYKVNYQMGLRTLVREACIFASLQNIQSVVKVYDCFEENGTAYIVMEFIRGETIVAYCERKGVSPKQLLSMLRETIQDLVRVHKAGIVHRDISPYNLLVQEDGSVRLIDFGASTAVEEDSQTFVTFNRSFAAPEQFDSDAKQGFGLDVYAMAATMYALMTGQVPQNALSRLKQDMMEKAKRINRRISRRVSDSIFEAMRLDPVKRTQSMEELWENLYNATRPLRTRRQKVAFALRVLMFVLLMEGIAMGFAECWRERYLRQAELAVRAVLFDDEDTAYRLATNYRLGILGEEGFSQNATLAKYWYRWACEHGSVEAMVDYGHLLQESTDSQEHLNAIQYYAQAAEAGDAVALNNMGIAYMKGEDVPQDIPLAIQCFESSAAAGCSLALVNMGCAYMEGIVGEKNEGKAYSFFRQAAEQNDSEALYYLGICYKNGLGVEANHLQSVRCLYEAAAAGEAMAMFEIGEMYRKAEMEVCDYEKAEEWYTEAFKAGFGGGAYGLGMLYRDGLGVEKDMNEAATQMFIALMWGYEPAKDELDKLIDMGYQPGE